MTCPECGYELLPLGAQKKNSLKDSAIYGEREWWILKNWKWCSICKRPQSLGETAKSEVSE